MAKEVYIKIDPDSLEWLRGMITNTLKNRNHPTTIGFYNELTAWEKGMSNPQTLQEILDEAGTAAPKRARKPREKIEKKKEVVAVQPQDEDKVDPRNCNSHPWYGGKRRPQSDCSGCWSVYKTFHPLDYDAKRRDFERKQKASAEG